MPSSSSVYFWGFAAILIYHVSSVFLFRGLDSSASCATAIAGTRGNSRILDGNGLGMAEDGGRRPSLRDFIPTNSDALRREREVS